MMDVAARPNRVAVDQMRRDSSKDQTERSDSAPAKVTVADDMQGTTQPYATIPVSSCVVVFRHDRQRIPIRSIRRPPW